MVRVQTHARNCRWTIQCIDVLLKTSRHMLGHDLMCMDFDIILFDTQGSSVYKCLRSCVWVRMIIYSIIVVALLIVGILNQIVGGLDGVCKHSYVWLLLCPWISYIDPISTIDMVIRSYMRHRGYNDMLFSEFVYDFEYTLFDQPYRNPHGVQNDTQMEYIYGYLMKQDTLIVPFVIFSGSQHPSSKLPRCFLRVGDTDKNWQHIKHPRRSS